MSQPNEAEKLIKIKERRLQILREQQSFFGKKTDPAVRMEIEDLKKEIAKLKGEPEPPSEAITSDLQTTSTGLPENQSGLNWTKIAAIATIIGVAVACIAVVISQDFLSLWISPPTTPSPAPVTGTFTYNVRVQDKLTTDGITNAVVTIEVGGKAPLDGITDSTGLARIFVSDSHAGQPGRLIVEADGYEKYRQEIDIVDGALPKDILLEPE